MLSSAVIAGIITNLTGGIFYTGFMIGNNISIVNVGIISFIPYIASILCVFAPTILERFRKRRWILAFAKLFYYTLNVLGITLLPVFVSDTKIKVICFAVIVFISGIVNSLCSSGYSSWQVNFLPDDVRADYFTLQHLFCNMITGIVVVISGIISDSLSASGHQLEIISILRYIAYFLALVDVVILSLPKEYPYLHTSENFKVLDIFRIPFKYKPFLLVMAVVFARTFSTTMSTSAHSYYLLNDAGVKYTFISGISAAYFLFFFIFSKFWKGMISRRGWLYTFAVAQILWAPTSFVYAFVNSQNYTWLMLPVRILQHILGVGVSITVANMAFIQLPETDRTYYISFFTIISSLSNFFGVMFGTLIISAFGDRLITMFGMTFYPAQILLFIESFFEIITALIAVNVSRTIKKSSAAVV